MALNLWQKVSILTVVILVIFYIFSTLFYFEWVKKRLIAENYKILNLNYPHLDWGRMRLFNYKKIVLEINGTVVWNGMPNKEVLINDALYFSASGIEHDVDERIMPNKVPPWTP